MCYILCTCSLVCIFWGGVEMLRTFPQMFNFYLSHIIIQGIIIEKYVTVGSFNCALENKCKKNQQ